MADNNTTPTSTDKLLIRSVGSDIWKWLSLSTLLTFFKAAYTDVNTGTSDTNFVTPAALQQSIRNTRIYKEICLSSTTSCSVLVLVGNAIESDFAGIITDCGASCDTAGVTGTMTIDILKNGVSILSTKITLDTTKKSSKTSATPPVISTNTIAIGDIYTFSVTGIHTTAAKGLTIWFKIQLT